MREALADHDKLISEAVTENGGYVVKSTGDGAYAVFHRAENAAAAAVAAQTLFQAEDFPGVGKLRLRMALHTGEADERGGDYFGTALNRAARLLGAGHGGQILVSGVTKEVLAEGENRFIDLGVHRLRDLTRPEHVHLLAYEGLPETFPALRSMDSRPNNLPLQLTSFIGRETEVNEVSALMATQRLVTLTGVGGTGKTRLALEAVGEMLDSSRDGAWFVDLAPIIDSDLVVSQVAAPFGVREIETDSEHGLLDVLCDYLASKNLILIIDNCEHVIAEVSRVAEQILSRCPEIAILATSRGLLGVPGEAVYPVPSLATATSGEAVSLFIDRASSIQPGFEVSQGSEEAINGIVERLEGLPLAIELAASRITVLSPKEILSRLDDQMKLIASRRVEGRHGTLEAALDWSYDLLSPPDREIFACLSVFAGTWDMSAAEAVAGEPELDVLDTLSHLVDQSLVEVADHESGRRFRLLEPVRQYAATKLAHSGDDDAIRRRHASYFASYADEGSHGLRGPDQVRWSERIRADHDNIRSAIDWSLTSGEHELALELTGAMGWFWWLRGHWKEALRWFWKVYEATTDVDPVLRSRLIYKVASLDIQRARLGDVIPLFNEALEIVREKGTPTDIAWTTVFAAEGAMNLELGEKAIDLFEAAGDPWGKAYAQVTNGQLKAIKNGSDEGLAQMAHGIDMILELGDRWTAGWLGFVLGQAYANRGEYGEARRVLERSRDLVAGTNDRWIAPHCTSRLGILATMTGHADEAKRLFAEAFPVHQRIGDQNCTALINTYMGELLTDEGNFTSADEQLTLAIQGYKDLQNPYGLARGIARAGWLAHAHGDSERAARLLGAAEAYREELGGSISDHDDRRHAEIAAHLRGQLGEEALDRLMDEGRAMSGDARVSHALGRQAS